MDIAEAKARCWAEIDLDALGSNYKTALSLLRPPARLICVLKANAYGLGAARVCRELYGLGARFFAVACACEAEEIKTLLPDSEVLVLGLSGAGETERLIKKGIILTCFSPENARHIIKCAKSANARARAHIKLDTGLHRIGFNESTYNEMLGFALNPAVSVEGLYTHLALHDRAGDEAQFVLFDKADAFLKAHGVGGYMCHACDSIGMVRYPERHMDAVRAGAWLYGVCPNRYAHPENCRPTVRFVCRISDIHDVRAGEYIGYDDDNPLARDSRVAALSAGYVDGFPRLNNIGRVLVRGRSARVLGLVCMDQMMVDVTDIPEARRGDEVTLLGDGIGVNEYADTARLNRNEALCRLGRRVPRLYMRNGAPESICRE
ncbi:MAG: alanine racemase [Clostridia bacterium]|nr:alanine racemase [Clostridia bacterium]